MARRKLPTQGVDALPAPPPMASLYDLGRQIVALSDLHDQLDTRELECGYGSEKGKALNQAKWRVFCQEEALVDFGLAMTPKTVPDVVAQLLLADRRLDEVVGCDMPIEDVREIAEGALRVIRASLPLLARAAGINLAEVAGQGIVLMGGTEPPEFRGAVA